MRKVNIEIDEEIFNFLQNQATPFVDTPNDVLRRLLLKSAPKIISVTKPASPNQSLPILPGGTPKALEHTLQVAYLVKFTKMTRPRATHRVADIHGVAPQTIIDKYCRQLELTAHQFDKLLQENDLKSLKELLHKKFPNQYKIINEYLIQKN
jgi:negative regulator of replication initiation